MRLLTLSLQLPLHPGDIPGFRAAIAGLVGLEHELFHQHANREAYEEALHWQYPLVQYAVRRGHASIIGMEEGADAIRKILLPALGDTLEFAGRERRIGGIFLKETSFELPLLNEPASFGLGGWIALNGANYAAWKAASDDGERLELLGRTLTGHLRAFGERLGMAEYKRIEARVLSVENQKKVRWHGADLVRFNVLAEANVSVPPGIGLGRMAAFGFGEALTPASYFRMLHLSAQRGNEVL